MQQINTKIFKRLEMLIIRSLMLLSFAQASLYAEPPSTENTLQQKSDARGLCKHQGTYTCATSSNGNVYPSNKTFHVDCHFTWKGCQPKSSLGELFINSCNGVIDNVGGLTNMVVPYTTFSNSYDCNSWCVMYNYFKRF